MNKNKLTLSNLIAKRPKIGYTPPKIFKQRARLIKLIAEASIVLNEHIKFSDDPDFWYSFDNKVEFFAALEEQFNVRVELEYELARLINNLIYYDQEKWGEYDCESIILRIAKHDKLTVPSTKLAKSETALQRKVRPK